MHVLLVVNTTASSVTDHVRSEVEQQLARHHDLDVVTTTHRGHANEVATTAVERGVDAIAVLAGDGTLNEVANALVGTDRVLASIPGGSTNVFARSIGLPRDAAAAAEVIALALTRGETTRIAVGEVRADGRGPRVFLCHTGIGWDAALVADVERRRDDGRRRATIPLFVRAGVRTVVSGYDRRNPHFGIGPFHLSQRSGVTPYGTTPPSAQPRRSDGSTIDDALFALVVNREPYTFLGPRPFIIAPDEAHRCGMVVVAMRSLALPGFLRIAAQALGGHGIRDTPSVVVETCVEAVAVDRLSTRTEGVPYQVDGDHLGTFEHLAFRHRPDALVVVRPAAPTP